MPARQDQTLQIVLVGTIFAVIVLFVLWYLYWKGYNESQQQIAKLNTDLNNARTEQSKFQGENSQLREWMGFGAKDNPDDVQKAFEEDMKRYGTALGADDQKSYSKVLAAVYKQFDDTAAREATAKAQVKDLTDRVQAVQSEADKQVAQYDVARKKAEEDAAGQRNQFAKDRGDLEKTKKDLLQKVEELKANSEMQVSERDAKIKELDERIAKVERAKDILLEERKDPTESFEVADGRISWVNQNGTVWINLGEADSLQRQVTFSVFDGDQHQADKAKKKGSIEITRVLGEHLSEARVTEDQATNPILTGDLVYSQVWHRGKKLRFALTGIMDIDDDGISDLQLARDLIAMNGGVVDTYIGDDGKVVGQMTPNTRYLVLGKAPSSAAQGDIQKAWDDMSKEAKDLGVQTITLEEFLDQMGYKPQDRTVRLGVGASAHDFPASAQEGVLMPGASGIPPTFRPRSPYRPKAQIQTPATPFAPAHPPVNSDSPKPTPY